MIEIGSEFWLDKSQIINEGQTIIDHICSRGDYQLLFSGRTAIGYVLNDILNSYHERSATKNLKNSWSVYMPSYCCYSMLHPFLARGFSICFYDVLVDDNGRIEYIIDYEKSCDIFFAMSYFGFSSTTMDLSIDKLKRKGTIIVEDITHRLFSKNEQSDNVDYSIASLRKWFAIPSGGIALKHGNQFTKQSLLNPDSTIVEKKFTAMTLKAEYINNLEAGNSSPGIDKDIFLQLFADFNSDLQNDYEAIMIDPLSRKLLLGGSFTSTFIKKRQENAHFLHQRMPRNEYIMPLIEEYEHKSDCLLFYPIRVDPRFRAHLRNFLSKNGIYCPIHWPVPDKVDLTSSTRKLYDEELSLVCDQRYTLDDMGRIINTIERFCSQNDRHIF